VNAERSDPFNDPKRRLPEGEPIEHSFEEAERRMSNQLQDHPQERKINSAGKPGFREAIALDVRPPNGHKNPRFARAGQGRSSKAAPAYVTAVKANLERSPFPGPVAGILKVLLGGNIRTGVFRPGFDPQGRG